MTYRALIAKIFSRETGVHDRDGLFRVAVFDREIAALDHFQTERGEITIRDRLRVAARPVAIGHVGLAIDFVLAEIRERHPEPIAHGRVLERRIGAERAQGADKKLVLGVVGRVIPFHQSHARAVNSVFVVAIILRGLVADRLDLQRRGDKQRRGESDLADDQDPRDRVHQPAAVTATAFFHHFRGVASGAQNRGDESGQERREKDDAESKSEDFAINGELDPVG